MRQRAVSDFVNMVRSFIWSCCNCFCSCM